ncbi:MAG: hypothetical protein FD153_536 [Rhodospirillaceae bacterium]|nr:MAG: hypothetical protein FD153_536 [Rhodospirillaceae bacterium]
MPEALKHEGDGATPAGCWPLQRVLYRPDRLLLPVTDLPVSALAPDDGWCDDPGHDAYNRPVKRPFSASHEPLWRTDVLYDVIVVLGYNDSPPRPGRGSAIFLHCATPTYDSTAGCVAVARSDLLHLLTGCREGDRLCLNREERDGVEPNVAYTSLIF